MSKFAPSITAAAVAASLICVQSSLAATYYWDENADAAGFGTAGTVATPWSSASSLFTTDANGLAAPSGTQATVAGDTANFGTAADGLGSGTVTVSGTVAATNLVFGSQSGAITLTGGTIASSGPLTVTVNNATDTLVTQFSSTTFTKEGTGTLVLASGNTSTGNAAINAGTVKITGGAGGLGGSGTTTTTIANGATLHFSRDNVTTPAYVIAGEGSVLQDGPAAGGVALTRTNTYSGGTTLTAGILNIGRESAIGTGTLAINGGTLNNITGGWTNTLTTNNAQIWNGDFTYSGSTGRTLNLGTGAVSTTGNRQVTVSAQTFSVGGAIGDGVNSYSLTKAGAGTLNLYGANTYNGATTVSAGTLIIGGSGALNGGTSTAIAAGATFSLNDNADYAFNILSNGTSNTLSGLDTAVANLNGDFVFNLPTLGAVTADTTWQIENVAALAGAYGVSFTVADFTDAGGDLWTLTRGQEAWTFSEASGQLSVVVPEPASLALLGLVGLGLRRRRKA